MPYIGSSMPKPHIESPVSNITQQHLNELGHGHKWVDLDPRRQEVEHFVTIRKF